MIQHNIVISHVTTAEILLGHGFSTPGYFYWTNSYVQYGIGYVHANTVLSSNIMQWFQGVQIDLI